VIELRVEVRPPWPFVLPLRSGLDGLTRVRRGVVHRLLHLGEEPVLVRVAQPAGDRVLFGARAASRELAAWGIERMRRALTVDRDLREFYERFRFDALIGPSLRMTPGLRPPGRPHSFEALAWAICEQLIEVERAAAIQRRLVWRLGRRCPDTGLRDSPAAAVVAGQAPARLCSWGLSEARAIALVRAAREVACGRVDLDAPDPEEGWRRLRAIPGIGSWTLEMLALTGQGRFDQIPAGDLAYRKLVGRLGAGGDPRARAEEHEVRELFEPYRPWAGLAGLHALRSSKLRVSQGADRRAVRMAGSSSKRAVSRRPSQVTVRASPVNGQGSSRWAPGASAGIS
jgi:3-methyladenine DNA glycosylase/8-oxoguanine DNA glycosylase